jgi:hypothetical protein
MLSGDLSTMSLADVLQWADGSRASGLLTIHRPAGPIWLQIADRQVTECAPAASRGVAAEYLAITSGDEPCFDEQARAIEMLYDQLLDAEDRFVFAPRAHSPQPGVVIDMTIQELVMTGMQYVDEWPFVRDLYPNGNVRMRRVDAPEPPSLAAAQAALLRLAALEPTLDELRLHVGLSLPALLRHVDLLRRLGCVAVGGAPPEIDSNEQLMRNALLLVRERQFDEASHVLATLLASAPGSPRVRELLRGVERRHIEHLHVSLPSRAVVRKRPRIDRVQRWLTRTDREVVERINDQWDVGAIVLSCTMREVETLKSLSKLQRLEAIELVLPSDRPPPPREVERPPSCGME